MSTNKKEDKKPLVKDKAMGIVRRNGKVLLVEVTFDLDNDKSSITKIVEKEDVQTALAQLEIDLEEILFKEI